MIIKLIKKLKIWNKKVILLIIERKVLILYWSTWFTYNKNDTKTIWKITGKTGINAKSIEVIIVRRTINVGL